jgi:hypothetical protein
MRISVENLRHELDVFLWENPDWADAQIVWQDTKGGALIARRVVKREKLGPTPFNIQFEEKMIYEYR